MPRYSVATTRNNLSQLIDKAVAGEEVIITRHGKPTVSLSVVQKEAASNVNMALRREWMERLQRLRDSLPPAKLSYLEIKKLDQAEYEH
jgi:antitoxin (DNA-binding transcriptional repressor) of toxin-antitoxin stability system